MGLESAGGQAR